MMNEVIAAQQLATWDQRKLAGLVVVLIFFVVLSSSPPSTDMGWLVKKGLLNNNLTTTILKSNQPSATGMVATTEASHRGDEDANVPNSKSNHSNARMAGCSATQSEPLNLESNVTFLHIGKAGGGTIFMEQLPAWRTNIHRCHPAPCHRQKKKQKKDANARNKENGGELFLINVRDPIDRFESAFYYTGKTLCNPDQELETRMGPQRKRGQNRKVDGTIKSHTTTNNNSSSQHTTVNRENGGNIRRSLVSDQKLASRCRNKPTLRSVWVYYTKYKENANLLAEALCSKNETARMDAQYNVRKIAHLGAVLHNWMKFLTSWLNADSDNVFPIVMTPPLVDNNSISRTNNTTLEEQVDLAVEWLYKKLHFESPQKFALRKMSVQCKKNNDATMNTTPQTTFQHSSRNTNHPMLSEKSKACLAEFYWSDYKWIDHIGKEMCKTVGCKQAVDAIFRRRASLLEPLWENEKKGLE